MMHRSLDVRSRITTTTHPPPPPPPLARNTSAPYRRWHTPLQQRAVTFVALASADVDAFDDTTIRIMAG